MDGVKSIEASILDSKFQYSFALKSAAFPELTAVDTASL